MDELEKDSWYYFTLPSEGDTWYPVWISDNNECVLDGKRIKLTKLEGMIFEKAVMPKAPTCTANERKILDDMKLIFKNQKDIPPDIADVLNKRFMDLF